MTTTNRKAPITDVEGFIKIAEQRGCYTDGQAENLRGSWHLFLAKAIEEEVAKSATVETVQPNVAKLFDAYGSNAKASASSIKAYTSRVERLLQDFVKWNNGNFMAWKQELEKKAPAANAKSRPKNKRATPPSAPPPPQEADSTKQIHQLRLPGGHKGELHLPSTLTKKAIEAAWKQLEALKSLLEAQVSVDDEDQEGEA